MKKIRIVESRPLSEKEVEKHRDFAALLQAYDESRRRSRRKVMTLIIPALAAAAAITLLILFPAEPQEKVPANLTAGPSLHEISPPVQDFSIPYATYSIDPKVDVSLEIQSGTKIRIPASAFVDASGAAITQKVEVSYREFHNQADFLLSGIPMVFDSTTGAFQFLSAGMFDFRATSAGSDVYIRDDNRIEIDFVSETQGDDYNFYRFDEEKGTWVTLRRDVKSEIAAGSEDEQGEEEPYSDESATITDFQPEVTLAEQVPLKPRLMKDEQKVFRFAADPEMFPELKAYSSGYFEVIDDDFDSRFFNLNWESASLDRPKETGGSYKLHLSRRDTTIHVDVMPVLSSAEYDKAYQKYVEDIEVYQARQDELIQVGIRQRRADARRAARNADRTTRVSRTVAISVPGVYNFDKPIRVEELLADKARPSFVDETRKAARVKVIYLIDQTINTYFTFFDRSEFRWNRANASMLWVQDMEDNFYYAELIELSGTNSGGPVFLVGREVDPLGLMQLQETFGVLIPDGA